MDDVVNASELKSAAQNIRARVQEALKSTAEREVIIYEPEFMIHSSHVVQNIEEAATRQADDESLASSLWGSDSDSRIKEFAERLAHVKGR
jgi:hypothetical protein